MITSKGIYSTVRDWQGKKVKPPADRKTIVAELGGVLVWSKTQRIHRIRYGLQIKEYTDDLAAGREFGLCLRHLVECEN